jgi:hypothetical protein
VEVGEHPLEAALGAIDGEDAEVFGADLLDAGKEGSTRLRDGVGAAGAGAGYGNYFRRRGERYPNSPGWQSECYCSSIKPTYQRIKM